jgi:ribonucleases P/MRP protein subunit RPP40
LFNVARSFDKYEVLLHLINLRNSAAGPDGLSAATLKKLAGDLACPLSQLFNLFMHMEDIPSLWKTALVVPIFKKGDSSLPSNYRPISLTCTLCKLFERCIKDSMLKFFNEHSVISSNQFGFLAKKSTCLNLLQSMNDWTKCLDDRQDCYVAYIDFTKAFDTVRINLLIYKLISVGICGKLLNCIFSLLSNRSQRVKVGDCLSSSKPVTMGVVQGSVLGPILFIIFINDLFQFLPKAAKTMLFADDMKSYLIARNEECVTNFSLILDSINNWARQWKLCISVEKSGWLRISNKHLLHKPTFYIGGNILKEFLCVKDLGLQYNGQVNFSQHIKSIVSKAKQRCYVIRKCFCSSDISIMKAAFKSYVRPLIEYCSPVWSPHTLQDIALIESVQRSFTRKIPALSHLSYSERIKHCGLLSLEHRRIITDLCLFHKIFYKYVDIDFSSEIIFNRNNTRGHCLKLFQIKSRTDVRLHFFISRTIKLWNAVPYDVISITNTKTFKRSIKANDILRNFLSFK